MHPKAEVLALHAAEQNEPDLAAARDVDGVSRTIDDDAAGMADRRRGIGAWRNKEIVGRGGKTSRRADPNRSGGRVDGDSDNRLRRCQRRGLGRSGDIKLDPRWAGRGRKVRPRDRYRRTRGPYGRSEPQDQRWAVCFVGGVDVALGGGGG